MILSFEYFGLLKYSNLGKKIYLMIPSTESQLIIAAIFITRLELVGLAAQASKAAPKIVTGSKSTTILMDSPFSELFQFSEPV